MVAEHSHYLSRIEKDVYSQVVALLKKVDPNLAHGAMAQFKLGEIQNFNSLVPSSQSEGLPFYSVSAGTPQQRQAAKAAFTSLAKRVEQKIRG